MTSKAFKYIAEGFQEDATKLLKDFVDTNSTEFSKFSEVWRKHNFALVFMGRPDDVELTEFTNEIFKISTTFLSSSSFYEKVGALYLLYSLFRTQISFPTIKIRLETTHWGIIKTLRIDAELNKHFTLLYCIDFLIKNAFLYVARQMLKGPTTTSLLKHFKDLKIASAISAMKINYKNDILEYSVSNNFKTLKDLNAEYLEEKKKLGKDVPICLDDYSETYQKFERDLQKLINPEASNEEEESVGSRRAKIKAQAFMNKTLDRLGKMNEGDGFNSDSNVRENEDNHEIPVKITGTRNKPRKLPKKHRKLGRPGKHIVDTEKPPEAESDFEMAMNRLLSEQQHLYLPPEETARSIKRRTKHDHYYKD